MIGHLDKIKTFEKLLNSAELSHALIFAGPAGIGKRTFAMYLCRQIYCDKESQKLVGGCGECHSCRLFDSQNFPDFYKVECSDRENSRVENVRELLNKLNLTSYSGKARIVILNDADFLSIQAANILLKSLEEPRPDTYYFLITANPSKLPITILSRAQLWNFTKLTSSELLQLADLRSIKADAEIAELADGSFETLLSIVNRADELSEVDSLLKKLLGGQVNELQAMIDKLHKLKDEGLLQPFLSVIIFKTRLALKKSADPETQRRLAVLLSNLSKSHYYVFDRNINIRYLMAQIFTDLIPAKYLGINDEDPESNLLNKVIV